MDNGFTQITRTEHLPTRIASQFAKRIYKGALKPGDKLPTEHELSKNFGVSRTVVREAIAQLRNEGLVETRQGVGAFVAEMQARQVRLEEGKLMDSSAFRDLYQLRVPLELEAAALAAVNHTPTQLAEMDDALSRISTGEDWGNTGVAADLEFHRIIAEATGNDYFAQFISVISDRISHAIVAARAQGGLEEVIAVTIEEHTEIRDAIEARDPGRARSAMRHHLVGSAQRIGLTLEFH